MPHSIKPFIHRVKNTITCTTTALFCLISQPAFASDAVSEIVLNLCDYLSGNVAKAIGVLVIIGLGYRTLVGRMDWRTAGSIAVGLGLIIGGSYYGSVLLGG
jgi:type IV secretory pathway VirB2 component (pilin)